MGFGEITTRLFLLSSYTKYFYDKSPIAKKLVTNPNNEFVDSIYYRELSKDSTSFNQFAKLENSYDDISSALELALASFYSPAVVSIRPPEAVAILPENDRNSPLKLASATLFAMAESKFFRPEDTAAVGRYEGMIKFIQDQHGLTRAEIDAYYREALYKEFRPIIEAEFNKVTIVVSPDMYLLTRLADGRYTLEHYTIYDETILSTHKSSGTSFDAFMRELGNKLPASAIREIRNKYALMPSIHYAKLKAQGYADALELATESLVNFYINPSQDNYNVIRGIHALMAVADNDYEIETGIYTAPFYARWSYGDAIKKIQSELYENLTKEDNRTFTANAPTYAGYLTDPKFDVFGR